MNGELSLTQCQQARLTRDVRFDGRFFVAVKTTGIFCRPICPATTPKEKNTEYFSNAALALQAGYRPCLRCRPDSAPGSWAWQGVATTFQRAIKLIEQGDLQQTNLSAFAERLGISDRYLRRLFNTHLGMSPKQYAQYHQLMFAKQLLHNSSMTISDVGLASGFNSVRRFNDAFQKILKLTPSEVRRRKTTQQQSNQIILAFRPPFQWQHLLAFYRPRAVANMEEVGDDFYLRTFQQNKAQGWLRISPHTDTTLKLAFNIDDVTELRNVIANIRRMFDLDASISVIEAHLGNTDLASLISPGIRIPGVWNTWEAGMRAILGQQVSVKAAIVQLNTLVAQLGKPLAQDAKQRLFPTPTAVARADLSFLKMPQSRKATIKRFAEYMLHHPDQHPREWLALKGIGPWTVSYARLRGLSEPDCFLDTDLVIKKAIAPFENFSPGSTSPWGSYATFHCWSSQP